MEWNPGQNPQVFRDPEVALFQISSHNGRSDQGCENVIMLITDGAPNNYKEIFDLYNKDKKVRFFSFLIGEEAIDFEQVKNMACNNRGYMVHVQNMADVEDKVQHYIRTMSRPIGQHAGDIQLEDAMWSGVYRERLYLPRPETFAEPVPITNQSYAVMNKMAARRKIRLQKTEARGRMFVTTVSFPVIVNKTFMGVAAVNIPLTELNQQAHPSNIGGRSYFFMLDQNGFIMFHPQLRPIVRKMVMDCDNSDPQQLDILYATEMLDRVYPQTNSYYSECIKGANFV
ncbi:cache domain protein, partial [Ancylostoma duodenale]